MRKTGKYQLYKAEKNNTIKAIKELNSKNTTLGLEFFRYTDEKNINNKVKIDNLHENLVKTTLNNDSKNTSFSREIVNNIRKLFGLKPLGLNQTDRMNRLLYQKYPKIDPIYKETIHEGIYSEIGVTKSGPTAIDLKRNEMNEVFKSLEIDTYHRNRPPAYADPIQPFDPEEHITQNNQSKNTIKNLFSRIKVTKNKISKETKQKDYTINETKIR